MFLDQVRRAVPVEGGHPEWIVYAERLRRSRRVQRHRHRPAFCEQQRSEGSPDFAFAASFEDVEGDAIDTRDWRCLYDSDTH